MSAISSERFALSVDKLSIVPLIVWCKIGRIFPDGHSYFRTNKGSFRNSGAPPSAGCKRRRLKSRMTDSRLLLLSTPAGQCFPSRNSTATASRGAVRETAICRTIEFANGFGTAKAGSAVPISPHSPGSSSHFRNPGPSSHFLSPGPGSHFRSAGPGTVTAWNQLCENSGIQSY